MNSYSWEINRQRDFYDQDKNMEKPSSKPLKVLPLDIKIEEKKK